VKGIGGREGRSVYCNQEGMEQEGGKGGRVRIICHQLYLRA